MSIKLMPSGDIKLAKQDSEEERSKIRMRIAELEEQEAQQIAAAQIQAKIEESSPYKWRNGEIAKCLGNYLTAVTSLFDVKYNEFTKTIEIDGADINDNIIARVIGAVNDELGHFPARDMLDNAIRQTALNNKYHPICDHLGGLVWDGIARAETLLVDHMGAPDTLSNREMTRKWLLSAVIRIMEPGSEVHSMLILQGPQGNGKTSLVKLLTYGYYDTRMPDVEKPERYVPILNSTWVVSFDELKDFGKKDINLLKNFLTANEDKARLAYERYAQTYKRHTVFMGATNDDTFLRDYTSDNERRFWVIKCLAEKSDHIVKTFTRDFVDQVWAEVMTWWRDGDRDIWLTKEATDELTATQKEVKTNSDDSLIDAVAELFVKKFNAPHDINEFVSQAVGRSQCSQENMKTLDCIPVAWVSKYISDVLHRSVSASYITKAPVFDDKVRVVSKRINGVVTKCFDIREWVESLHFEIAKEAPTTQTTPQEVASPRLNLTAGDLFV